jgi:hypothetical protein
MLVTAVELFTVSRANRDRLVELAAKYLLPAMFSLSETAETGGLISYGADPVDGYSVAQRLSSQHYRLASARASWLIASWWFSFLISAKLRAILSSIRWCGVICRGASSPTPS